VILVGDGYSVDSGRTRAIADWLKSNGTVIYGVANGEGSQLSELTQIASSPDSQYVLQLWRHSLRLSDAARPTLQSLNTAQSGPVCLFCCNHADGSRGFFLPPCICVSVCFFRTISQSSMQLGSPNVTTKCSTMSSGNRLIF